MKRLLKLLFVTTLMLPLIAGTVAVLSGFGDPWGMGAINPWGVFITAALPILPPGLWQLLAWPLTYGVAVLVSPLALLRRRQYYLIAVLLYLATISGFWLHGWVLAPDHLNMMFDPQSYVEPGRLSSRLWQFGVYLLTDTAVLVAAVLWWFWRENAPNPTPEDVRSGGRVPPKASVRSNSFMRNQTVIQWLAWGALILGALCSSVLMAFGLTQEVLGHVAWALMPYAVLAAILLCARLFRIDRSVQLLSAWASIVIAMGGSLLYIDALYVHVDAQAGLVALMIPVIQTNLSMVVIVVVILWQWRISRSAAKPTSPNG